MRRLLVSIHDVTPAHEKRLDKLAPIIERHVGYGRFALLVVPDFHGRAPLKSGTPFALQLRAWADAGCEIFLHGFTHRDDSTHNSVTSQIMANRLTAGEGEFLALTYGEARERLAEGRRIVEDISGRAVAGFIAPAWLYSAESRRAIADCGFPFAEDHFKVWHPATNQSLAWGPVLTYASRTPMRLASSLIWSRVATQVLKPLPVVRFAVHPHDTDSPALLKEIERALATLKKSHVPARYRDLLHFHRRIVEPARA